MVIGDTLSKYLMGQAIGKKEKAGEYKNKQAFADLSYTQLS